MNKSFKTFTAAVALLAIAGTPSATPQQTGQYGAWKTFAGTSNDGTALMCVAGLSGAERSLYINYQRTDRGDAMGVQLYKTSWKIPAGTKVAITMQVDQAPPMKLVAVGFHNSTAHMDGIQAGIGADDVWDQTGKPMASEIMSMIGDGKVVRFFFPSGNEAPWEGSLNGSRAAMINLSQCVGALDAAVAETAKPKATQPFTPKPTQPFSPAPVLGEKQL